MDKDRTTIAEQLKAGKPVAVFTKGSSMEPLLYDQRTHVIIEPLRRGLAMGELPIFIRPDGKYVIHRIIGMDNECYYTRGDHCIHTEKIPRDWVLGVASEIYRNGRKIRVTDRSYRFYVRLCFLTAPIRIIFYRIKAQIRIR